MAETETSVVDPWPDAYGDDLGSPRTPERPWRLPVETFGLSTADARNLACRSRVRHKVVAMARADAALRDPRLVFGLEVLRTGMSGATIEAEIGALRQVMVLIRHALGALHLVAVGTDPPSHAIWSDGGADFGAAGPPGQVVAADPCRRHAPPRASSPHRREAAVAA